MRRWLAVLVLALAAAAPAGALVLASGDGAGNTTPPAPDPGWRHVGRRAAGNVLAVVYLGNGWAITAHHIGPGDVVLDDVTHPWVPGTARQLTNEDGSASDLVVFRLRAAPALPVLPIRATPPSVGDPVVLVGRGRQRTAPTAWQGHQGYALGTSGYLRWGTNVVEQTGLTLQGRGTRTHGFSTSFSAEGGTPHEAQAAAGDSGGPVFARNGPTWELAGLAHATANVPGQPADVVLFGSQTLISDLSRYKAQLDAILSAGAAPEASAPRLAAREDALAREDAMPPAWVLAYHAGPCGRSVAPRDRARVAAPRARPGETR